MIEAFQYLPGVGPKSAQRMAFALLAEKNRKKGYELSKIVTKAIENVSYCKQCCTYTEETLCQLCQNKKRNQKVLCVVETPADIMAIEIGNMYSGLYYVLHGHLSPLDGIGPKELGIPALFRRIEEEKIKELIVATNPTMEGKATANYIAGQISPEKTKCTRIAHGVPLGSELEYLDSETLTHAFYSRVQME